MTKIVTSLKGFRGLFNDSSKDRTLNSQVSDITKFNASSKSFSFLNNEPEIYNESDLVIKWNAQVADALKNSPRYYSAENLMKEIEGN